MCRPPSRIFLKLWLADKKIRLISGLAEFTRLIKISAEKKKNSAKIRLTGIQCKCCITQMYASATNFIVCSYMKTSNICIVLRLVKRLALVVQISSLRHHNVKIVMNKCYAMQLFSGQA